MGIIQAFTGALGGTFADQWKDVITAGYFGEYTAVAPGIFQQTNNGRGANYRGSVDVISNGSKIFVPEGTAAFIFSQAGIEDVITTPGGYEYQAGMKSVFNGDGFGAIVDETIHRVGFGGQSSEQKRIAFVNLREIRGLKFGTRSPLVYNDLFYGTDLEISAFGTFSLRIVDPVLFLRNFVPANVRTYSFDSPEARQQVLAEFIQAFTVALNSLSSSYRISQLPSQAAAIAALISGAGSPMGTWTDRFGIEVVQVGIESIEFSPASRELVKQYSANVMNLKAYDSVSAHASNVAAQQKIAQGVQDHGLGDGAGMLFGVGLAQSISPITAARAVEAAPAASTTPPMTPDAAPRALSLDEQIDAVKKLKELLDVGVLTQEEFDIKKREIMGL